MFLPILYVFNSRPHDICGRFLCPLVRKFFAEFEFLNYPYILCFNIWLLACLRSFTVCSTGLVWRCSICSILLTIVVFTIIIISSNSFLWWWTTDTMPVFVYQTHQRLFACKTNRLVLSKQIKAQIQRHCFSPTASEYTLYDLFKGIQDSLRGIQDSLGFWIPRGGFRISGTGVRISCQRNLDSWFQSLAGLKISWAVFSIPKPGIPDFTIKNLSDSGIRIP